MPETFRRIRRVVGHAVLAYSTSGLPGTISTFYGLDTAGCEPSRKRTCTCLFLTDRHGAAVVRGFGALSPRPVTVCFVTPYVRFAPTLSHWRTSERTQARCGSFARMSDVRLPKGLLHRKRGLTRPLLAICQLESEHGSEVTSDSGSFPLTTVVQ